MLPPWRSDARAPRAARVLQQAVHASGQKARTPAGRDALIGVVLLGDILLRHVLGGHQHDTRANLNARLDTLAPGKKSQAPIIIGIRLDWFGNSHGTDLLPV